MSEAVVRAERELFAYVAALQDALRIAAEDALPQSLWDGPGDASANGDAPEDVPDTLLQRVERETAHERHRTHDLVRRRIAPAHAALCATITQLGGGTDASGNVVDVPVEILDREIAAAAAESAELGRRMVDLYDETAEVATRIENVLLSTKVPSL